MWKTVLVCQEQERQGGSDNPSMLLEGPSNMQQPNSLNMLPHTHTLNTPLMNQDSTTQTYTDVGIHERHPQRVQVFIHKGVIIGLL